jgi:MinD superfamily P-loop ATPase
MSEIKQLTVISGKGGTGKTTITAMLSYLAYPVIADCDVDAPNLHLLLNPVVVEEIPFCGGKKAFIDGELCTECNLCYELCRFGAVTLNGEYRIDEMRCEGCALCYNACPSGAISMTTPETGKIFISKTRYGSMIHASLNPGEENSGQLVSEVRAKARDICKDENKKLLILDGAPGIGCPVIASLNSATLALIVSEPTLSGLRDAQRVLKLTEHFKIKSVMAINKFNLNEDMVRKFEKFCEKSNIEIVGKIPFDLALHSQISGLKFPFEGEAADAINDMWEKICPMLR